MMDDAHELRFSYVYPGHPVIVAICIIHAYDKASDALKPTEHGWCHAVGSAKVPGAGDCARAGSDIIRMLHEGKSVTEAIEFANDYWQRLTRPGSNNHEEQRISGQEQANRNIELFKQMVKNWDLS